MGTMHSEGKGGPMAAADLAALAQAKQLLEHPSYMARVTDAIGMPIENAVKALPASWSKGISTVTTASLNKCFKVANATLLPTGNTSHPKMHSVAVAVTGALGGAFGIAGLAVELPVSTTVMLRSIADIGRANGEMLGTPEAQLACLMVFSLGGKSGDDDASESGYFAARVALARAMSEATAYLSKHAVAQESAPALVRLIAQIAAKFNVQVSQKAAAMMVPVLGAAGGALVNTLFINHFQDMARGHFTVRRLERLYGPEVVSAAYRALPK
ncbi:EcsC family protein [Massilia glaciei]|nr:EcsC family protein [Massilia glaciei]